MNDETQSLSVTSEIGTLKKVLIHSPDGGVGYVPRSKVHDWLYDDVVDVQQMQKEYNYFVQILLLFLDIDKLFQNGKFRPDAVKFNPENTQYFGKDLETSCVIDTQYCLAQIFLDEETATNELISSISTIEGLNFDRKKELQDIYKQALREYRNPPNKIASDNFELGKSMFMDLAKTFITGRIEWEWDTKSKKYKKATAPKKGCYIFPPIANFIFTRDIGVTIKNCVFIAKPRFDIRRREVVLLKFILENSKVKALSEKKIIEIGEDDDSFQIEDRFKDESRVSFEGGDIMMISKEHILMGCSERTSPYAIQKFIHRVFDEKLAKLVSVVKISEKRSQMHIDTILSQIRRETWIMFGQLSEEWQREQSGENWYRFEYADAIRQKSENQVRKERLVTVIQFYCNSDDNDYDNKTNYQVYSKAEIDLMKLTNVSPVKDKKKYQTYESLKRKGFKYTKPTGLKDLLRQISVNDFGVPSKNKVKFIHCGGGVSPNDEREQWTDACNLLVIREGIAIGYDRNKRTSEAFEDLMLGFPDRKPTSKMREKARAIKINANQDLRGFLDWLMEKQNKERREQDRNEFNYPYELNVHVIHATDLIEYFNDSLGYQDKATILRFVSEMKNTLILLPSNELSRARGGSHCMTMPLWRDQINK